MPARHQGGFLWSYLHIPPPLGQTYQSEFSEPLQTHGLLRLRHPASPPQTLAAQGSLPRLFLCDSITHVEAGCSIATLQLFELHYPQLPAYPAIQFQQLVVAADVPIVVNPTPQRQIQPGNNFRVPPRTVPPCQLPNRILKTADTLRRQSKAPVVETGDSQESFFR
jgi:hypothetical protein